MADTPAQPNQGYGKLIALVVGAPIAAGICDTADLYLPHPLPTTAHEAVVIVVSLIAVWLVPHDVIARFMGNQ